MKRCKRRGLNTRKLVGIFNFILLIVLVGTPLVAIFSTNSDNEIAIKKYDLNDSITIRGSDVAGTDLYAEQISAYVAGSKSIIRQSLFTNDTNIFPHFDTNDPAFFKCNMLMSASNGIVPDMFPYTLSNNIFGTQFAFSYNSFIGFLYYDDILSPKEAQFKASRALDIIKSKFSIDLIMVNSTTANFFPFVGYYPDWEIYFSEITNNLPMDGYWDAFDIDRLSSRSYIDNHHLSSTFLLINSLNFLEQGVNISTDQLNFNFGAMDFSYLQNMDIEDVMDQLTSVVVGADDILGNLSQYLNIEALNQTLSQENIQQISQVMGSFALSNDSNYMTLLVQYEGLDDGITNIGPNQYSFNLLNALGYKRALHPSEKIYIAMAGAFMSELDINILGTNILDFTPKYFNFYDYMLEQIGLILFLADVNFDIQSIKDYSLELLWVNEDGVYRNYVRPVNLNNPQDYVNYLAQYGFQGFPFIPTGILNPIDTFVISYEVGYSESNLLLTKELIGENASYGIYRPFSFNITATNVGNISAWGVPTPIEVDLEALFSGFYGNYLGPLIYDALWTTINSMPEYKGKYTSLEDFLGLDEDPRIFYFDTWGQGINDYYYPDLANASNLFPYSENMLDVIDTMTPWLVSIGADPEALKAAFTNPSSIWNKANWELKPGKKISYISNNISLAVYDSFTPFYSYNFTIKNTPLKLPAMISGTTLSGSGPELALNNDNESWVITSQEQYVDQHEIEVQFLFKNQTSIDLINNTLERVSLVLNFSTPTGLDTLSYEIFNYTIEEFQDISTKLISNVNNTLTFAFTRQNNTLQGLFDPYAPNNYTITFKLKAIDANPFNISINDFDVVFSLRDINAYQILGSRVQYAPANGKAQLEKRSNSFMVSTYDMASITAIANLTRYSTRVGELNTYTLVFKNIGSRPAMNITISLLIPGIIQNKNNFTVKENQLHYVLLELLPGDEKKISCSYYTPNSGAISDALITYDNPVKVTNLNESSLSTLLNDAYFSAPVDYALRFPYLRTIQVRYESSNLAPSIGSTFTLKVYIKNKGPAGVSIPDLNLTMNDYYGDLRRTDSNSLNLTNIIYNTEPSVEISLLKEDWKGYYYPPINFIHSSESRTIQISRSLPIVLGTIDFEIEKSIDQSQVEIGDKIIVTLKITNTGTISIKDVNLMDDISFMQQDFSLQEGKLVNEIDRLDPGETKEFEYTIKAKQQNNMTLNEAYVDYYFLSKQENESNDLDVKIIIPRWIQTLFILIPSVIALGILGVLYQQTHRYKQGKYELQRNEAEIFNLSSIDAVLKIEHTLRESLNMISKKKSPQIKAEVPKKALTIKPKEQPKVLQNKKEEINAENLSKWTENDLKEYCSKNNINLPPKANKTEIIKQILTSTNNKNQTSGV